MEIIIVNPIERSVIRRGEEVEVKIEELPVGLKEKLLAALSPEKGKDRLQMVRVADNVEYSIFTYCLTGNTTLEHEQDIAKREKAKKAFSLLVWFFKPHLYALSRAIGADVKCLDCGQLAHGYEKYCCNQDCPSHKMWAAIYGG